MDNNVTALQWGGSTKQFTFIKITGYVFGIIFLPFSIGAVITVPLFGILLLAVNIFMIVYAHHCSKKLKTLKTQGVKSFDDYLKKNGFMQSREIGTLKIDETNKRWLVKRYGKIIPHDFSEIEDVEIVQNGEVYKSSGGVFRGVVGGAVFGIAGAVVGAATAKKQQSINSLSVVVRLNNLNCPIEKIDILSTSTKTESFTFRVLYDVAQQTASCLLTLKNM